MSFNLTDVDTGTNLGDGRFLRNNVVIMILHFDQYAQTRLLTMILLVMVLTATSNLKLSCPFYEGIVSFCFLSDSSIRGKNYNMTTINVVHDGTITYMSEFGTNGIPTGIGWIFSTEISGIGNLKLLGFPS